MSATDEAVVRRLYEQMCNERKNDIAPTGNKVEVDAISIHRVQDGKIAETWQVWDTLGFLQQLGVVPKP
jgi:predicted ester cyclase